MRHPVAAAVIAAVAVLAPAACTSGPPPSVPGTSSAPVTSSSSAPGSIRSRAAARATSARHPTSSAQRPVATIVLNPGHNGDNANNPKVSFRVDVGYGHSNFCDTTGTTTRAGYAEHAFNWDVAVRVRAVLQAHGVRVIMTRPDDHSAGPCITTRAAIGNRVGVTAVVSIHADGTPSGAGHGFHICEDSRPPAGPVVAAASHALTVALHDSVLRSSGFTVSTYLGHDGYYPREDFGALNLARVPSTFLELGNMKDPGDAALQSSPAGRARIAASVAAGILAWLARR